MSSESERQNLSGIVSVSKAVWEDQQITATEDWTAAETPIAFEYNCVSHAVMMATPADLEDFAVGFSVSEGIVTAASDILDIEVAEVDGGTVVSMIIGAEQLEALKQRRRSLVGRTGCGICGAETIADALRWPPRLTSSGPVVQHCAVQSALTQLAELQHLNQATGAIHAAAWCAADGSIELVREDVGRHNALDKLVGVLLRNPVGAENTKPMDLENGFVLISSRASYEMVSKAAVLGATILVAVSGVTHLAIQMAEASNLTLVGFSRPGRHSVYTHPERLR